MLTSMAMFPDGGPVSGGRFRKNRLGIANTLELEQNLLAIPVVGPCQDAKWGLRKTGGSGIDAG
jgi:hypothetical protein